MVSSQSQATLYSFFTVPLPLQALSQMTKVVITHTAFTAGLPQSVLGTPTISARTPMKPSNSFKGQSPSRLSAAALGLDRAPQSNLHLPDQDLSSTPRWSPPHALLASPGNAGLSLLPKVSWELKSPTLGCSTQDLLNWISSEVPLVEDAYS